MILKFRHLSRPRVLKRIGRGLLQRFLEEFAAELKSVDVELPAAASADDAYFAVMAAVFSHPERLPDRLNEALFAIDELGGPDGQEQLELALERNGAHVALPPDSSREDLAVQVWLANPALLARVHNQQRLSRLTAFEHFGSVVPVGVRPRFERPNAATLEALRAELDPWFTRHLRGRDTTRLECYELEGEREHDADGVSEQGGHERPGSSGSEFWFLVRHGEPYARTPTVSAQKTEILHFRPERDDVVVYSPAQEELRINARTRGERELYVRKFGLVLRGSEDFFSSRWTYTLEPLRDEGAGALDSSGVTGITAVTLRQIEIAFGGAAGQKLTMEAGDIFACPPASADWGATIPREGRLVRAAFEFKFQGCPRARQVQLRLPNVLKVSRNCDATLVERWLRLRRFRRSID